MVRFLQIAANGGTDLTEAIDHSLQLLSEGDCKNADVLVISDFVMGNLSETQVKAIEEEKEKNTDFYSLEIGTTGNKDVLAQFNHNWQYNTSDTHATRKLVEQLHELKTRK
ncbi:MAG: hypothetical protein IJ158_10740 [Treponema sp.]|nr:hypothetical protein [Treponema sp.]